MEIALHANITFEMNQPAGFNIHEKLMENIIKSDCQSKLEQTNVVVTDLMQT